jgi:membrane fusion protein (multidrug efflux system)
VLLATIALTAVGLAAWKAAAIQEGSAAAASQPEPMEMVTPAVAREHQHRQTTTSIGTVLASRSITLRNEMSGTVRQVSLSPGQIVEPGTVLVALDVSVEQAELEAQQAQAALAQTTLQRLERLRADQAASVEEVDQARAQRDVALAQVARTRAIIDRKTIRAPFRAQVGIADVHPGQYLNEGSTLTTLQGVEDAANVDFSVAQQVASVLRAGQSVQVFAQEGVPIAATIVAVDARVDPTTRNAMVRARIGRGGSALAPGASVRVIIPTGPSSTSVVVPVSALRRGPAGDHVFVLTPDEKGGTRAHVRPVASGTVLGDQVVILEGLEVGEQVAAAGSFKLREAVLVVTEQPAAEGAQDAGATEKPAAEKEAP